MTKTLPGSVGPARQAFRRPGAGRAWCRCVDYSQSCSRGCGGLRRDARGVASSTSTDGVTLVPVPLVDLLRRPTFSVRIPEAEPSVRGGANGLTPQPGPGSQPRSPSLAGPAAGAVHLPGAVLRVQRRGCLQLSTAGRRQLAPESPGERGAAHRCHRDPESWAAGSPGAALLRGHGPGRRAFSQGRSSRRGSTCSTSRCVPRRSRTRRRGRRWTAPTWRSGPAPPRSPGS